MTAKQATAPKKVDESGEYAIRQIFYMNKCFKENIIKILERTYRHQKKTEEEWVEILSNKGITF